MFPFDFFFTFFFIAFLTIFVLVILTTFLRISRRPHGTTSTEEEAAAIKEREIIREIVKIRCPYCNILYDEKYDKCPHCGGKRRA